MNIQDNENLPNLIREVLNGREPKNIHAGAYSHRHAGVLIPLLEDKGIYKILFTKRTDTVERHKGQISFPGGSVDKEDSSLLETALRESEEEIGLLKGDVDILGRIDDTLTVASDFIVRPFVGLVPFPYEFVINEEEVERLIIVPIDIFKTENSENSVHAVEFEGKTYHSKAYEYNGDVIWGATARMIENLMGIIKRRLSLPHNRK
jgi:8-oxo-dGTP pyrophosphatase MutT (NUDIX family)